MAFVVKVNNETVGTFDEEDDALTEYQAQLHENPDAEVVVVEE